MSKPEIKYEDIPDEEIMTSKSLSIDKRYWYPKMQKSKFQCNDAIYIELKNYLINFYNSQPKTQFLYWTRIYEESSLKESVDSNYESEESADESDNESDNEKLGNLENDNVEAWDCPITIEYLNFGPYGCGCCGIICEIPEFGGEILINDKKYKYEGSIGSERWCERDNFKHNTRMFDKEILHRLNSLEDLCKKEKIELINLSTADWTILPFKKEIYENF